jgi:hypothetical protein
VVGRGVATLGKEKVQSSQFKVQIELGSVGLVGEGGDGPGGVAGVVALEDGVDEEGGGAAVVGEGDVLDRGVEVVLVEGRAELRGGGAGQRGDAPELLEERLVAGREPAVAGEPGERGL